MRRRPPIGYGCRLFHNAAFFVPALLAGFLVFSLSAQRLLVFGFAILRWGLVNFGEYTVFTIIDAGPDLRVSLARRGEDRLPGRSRIASQSRMSLAGIFVRAGISVMGKRSLAESNVPPNNSWAMGVNHERVASSRERAKGLMV